MGPVTFNRIGANYKDGVLWFLLDADFNVSDFTLADDIEHPAVMCFVMTVMLMLFMMILSGSPIVQKQKRGQNKPNQEDGGAAHPVLARQAGEAGRFRHGGLTASVGGWLLMLDPRG